MDYNIRVKISTLSGGAHVGMTPRWDDSSSRSIEIESGEIFHRDTWKIKLYFQRNDYPFIFNAPLDTLFTVKVYESESDPLSDYIWRGRFTRFNCDIDEDYKTIEVEPINADKYDKILSSKDKEWNLIDLAPAITEVNIKRQPVLQVYLFGGSLISNFMGGTYWETVKVGDFNSSSLVKNVFIIPGDSSVLNPDVSGEYYYDGGTNEHGRSDGAYYIKYNPTFGVTAWEILEFGTNIVRFRAGAGEGLPAFATPFTPGTITFTSLVNGSTCEIYGIDLRARLLTNNATLPSIGATDPIVSGDQEENNPIYDRVIGIDLAGTGYVDLTFSAGFGNSIDPDKWGKYHSGSMHFADNYFVSPIGGYLPIQRNDWTGYGFWLLYTPPIQILQEEGSNDLTIKHCYKLPDVLSALLAVIDPEITHEESSDWSDFFYASNSIRTSMKMPIITPKSNLLAGEYDQPASKAMIKLSDVTNMLKYVYNVFWDIDSNMRLRLEHFDFYYNGGVYYTENVGKDLTTLLEPKTGSRWDYYSSKYKYDNPQVPERIETKWMDNQSKAFEGSPIEMLSNYAEKGNIEQRQISMFSSDIDFMLANAESMSKDGFVLIDAVYDGGVYSTHFANLSAYGFDGVVAQNGYLSLAWLAWNYHRHGLPVHNVNINGMDETATTEKRIKIQEIVFPGFDFDPINLIKTQLGDGQIESLEINLFHGDIKGKIKHNA